MKLKSIIASVALLSIFSIAPANAEATDRFISVNAEGMVKVVPNAVRIMAQVTVVDSTNAAALSNANITSAAVRKAIIANGISTKDFATTSLTVFPEYNYTQEKGNIQIGYRASQSFTVIVKNATNAGVVVDAIAAAGGDNLQLQNVVPFVLDNSKANESARANAVRNAKAKAASYAKLLGVKLGKVLRISEGAPVYRPQPIGFSTKSESDSQTVIDLGTQEVSVSISVQWALI